jgi:hypothetical protein
MTTVSTTTPRAGIDLENRPQTLSSFTGHLEEAVLAFQEKRPPNFDSNA